MNGHLHAVKHFDWNLPLGNKACACHLGYGDIRHIKESAVSPAWWIDQQGKDKQLNAKMYKIREHSTDGKEAQWPINNEKMLSLKNFIWEMQSKRNMIFHKYIGTNFKM